MNSRAPLTPYEPVLVPALHAIQHKHGYLEREAMEQFSRDSGIPLARMHAVASFFPHFEVEPPKKVTVRVCRDMACAMSGSRNTLAELQALAGDHVKVEGVSCLGRCDRPAAACVTVAGEHHEFFYHGKSTPELAEIVETCLHGHPPAQDSDVEWVNSLANSEADLYQGKPAAYAGIHKAIAVRDESIRASVELLREKYGWTAGKMEQFRLAASSQLRTGFPIDDDVAEAVLDWQTERGWAKGALGGWSETILAEIKDADLRGMGGAGIPSVQKLRDVRDAIRTARLRQADDRGFIVVNGDESEPATFKDREILLRIPHTVVEGVILAGLVTEASQGFIYIRHEYPEEIEACRQEIARAEALGLCGMNASALGRSFPLSVFASPGGYICGEQSALIEAMSDRRGEPRNMPPKLETNGLIDLPTIVSNVETYAWMPYIWVKTGKTYASLGVNGWKGRRIFSISGDVNRPGVYEVPMGMTLRELIEGENYCQGMVNGLPLKALAPSGPSGGFLPATLTPGNGLPRDHVNNDAWKALAERRGFDPNAQELSILDLELELNLFRSLSPTQALGAGIVVYAEGRNMMEQALNSLEFFRAESCGKCVPCRTGSQKLASLAEYIVNGQVSASRWKDELWPMVQEMNRAIELASICGLGRSVPVPLKTVASYFKQDLAQHAR